MALIEENKKYVDKDCQDYARKISPDAAYTEKLSWLLTELVNNYGYPKGWLGSRIKLHSVNYDIGNGVVTLGLYTESGYPFIFATLVPPGEIKGGLTILKNEMLSNVCTVVGFVTDGTDISTRFIRRKPKSSEFEQLRDIETYKKDLLSNMGQVFVASREGGKNKGLNRSLTILTEKAEGLFFEAHSHIRDIDGLHADEALDELCKVLYTKLYDEETCKINEAYKMQRKRYGSIEECAAAIRALYHEANEYDQRVFSLRIPGYKRSRGVFNQRIALSSAALVKVVDTFESFDISNSAIDVKGRAFQKVFQPALRAGMGQYFTPTPIIDLIVRILAPTVSDLILDPFAGSGHFLSFSLKYVKNQEVRKKLVNEFAFHKLHGIEKSERMVRIAMTDMRLHGDGHSNLRCTDALLDFSNYHDLEPESFDVIMTNPPFGSILGKDAVTQLGEFEMTSNKNTIPLEILGLERATQFLRPGGRIGIVLPESILVNASNRNLREWIRKKLCVRAIVSLPLETFAPYGANIKTCVLFARKWLSNEYSSQYKVFMCLVENVGYDSTGRLRMSTDKKEAEIELLKFLEKEGW